MSINRQIFDDSSKKGESTKLQVFGRMKRTSMVAEINLMVGINMMIGISISLEKDMGIEIDTSAMRELR